MENWAERLTDEDDMRRRFIKLVLEHLSNMESQQQAADNGESPIAASIFAAIEDKTLEQRVKSIDYLLLHINCVVGATSEFVAVNNRLLLDVVGQWLSEKK